MLMCRLKVLISILILIGVIRSSPKITFEETTYDFGKVERGKKITHYFNFKNTGDEVLEIIKVKKSCGCQLAKTTKKYLKPGESAKIMVVYDSKGYSGAVSKIVTVKSNDPANPEVTLTIKGFVESMYNIKPGFVSFGIIKPDSQPSETVTVTFKRKDIKVKRITTNSDYIKLRVLGQRDSIYTFIVGLAPNVPEGSFAGKVELDVSNVLDSIVRVAVVAKVAGDVEVLPSMLGFGAPRGKSKPIQFQILTSENIKDLEIDSVKLENSYILAKVDSIRKNSDKIVVNLLFNVLKDAPTGVVQCTLNVYTNNRKYKEIKIPVTGYIR